MSKHADLISKLDAAGITYELSHHDPTPTSADAARVRGVDLHTGAKAIVTKGHKTGKHYLFVLPADMKLDNKKARDTVGENVGFAADVEAVTGCVPGSVPPFGSVIGLPTFVDRHLAENDIINFNAASLTDSVAMKYSDYLAIEQPIVVEIAK